MLYKQVPVDEETPVQYAAVYVTRWKPQWGEPACLFVEEPDSSNFAEIRQLAVDLALALSYEMLWDERFQESERIIEKARDILDIQDQLAEVESSKHPLADRK